MNESVLPRSARSSFEDVAMLAVFDAVADSIIVIDTTATIRATNAATLRAFGYTSEELVGANIAMLMTAKDASAHDGYIQKYVETAVSHIIGVGRDLRGRRKDGSEFPVHLSVSEFESAGERLFVGTLRDLSEQRAYDDRIAHMATHDELTGALNRHGVTDALGVAIADATARGAQLATLFIDLDGFKRVNDNHGHRIGDQLLAKVVERARAHLRSGDAIARVGGDEFLVVLAIDDRVDAEAVASRMAASLSQPFDLGDRKVEVGVSVGISLFPDHATSADELMNHADMAMYRIKRDDTASVLVFDPELKEAAEKEYELLGRLREAVEAEQFVVHYQLQFDLRTLEPIGIEALVRWQEPQRGLVMPGDFIELALDNGLITPITRMVLRQACVDNAALSELGLLDGPVAVNIPAPLFGDADFVPLVREVLDASGLYPEQLELEIVENIAMTATPMLARNALELIDLGVSVAMDDFGTGFSSMRQLSEQHFGKLKIDRTFVDQLPGSARDAAIVTAMIDMADGLGVEVVAEGIETLEQCNYLKGQGCLYGQGYWYHRPMPLSDLVRWLENQQGVELDA